MFICVWTARALNFTTCVKMQFGMLMTLELLRNKDALRQHDLIKPIHTLKINSLRMKYKILYMTIVSKSVRFISSSTPRGWLIVKRNLCSLWVACREGMLLISFVLCWLRHLRYPRSATLSARLTKHFILKRMKKIATWTVLIIAGKCLIWFRWFYNKKIHINRPHYFHS